MDTPAKIIIRSRDLTPSTNRALKHAAFQLQVEIDGVVHDARWGESTVEVEPGAHQVRIFCRHVIYGEKAVRDTSVDVLPNSSCELAYTLQGFRNLEAVLEVDGRPDATGLVVQSGSQRGRNQLVYVMILLLGPLMVFGSGFLGPGERNWFIFALGGLCVVYALVHIIRRRAKSV